MAKAIRLRVNVSAPFPAQVVGANGVDASKANGIYTISNNYPSLAQLTNIPDLTQKTAVLYDITTHIYNTAPVSVISSGSPTTFSGLPAATSVNKGVRRFVTDSNTVTFNAVVAGGGTNNVPVFSDGTTWRVG